MALTFLYLLTTLVLSLHYPVSALDNGLALTPPMGWVSGQRFVCNTDCQNYPDDCISEKLIQSTADVMVKDGYQKAGYQYVVIHDCWSNRDRDSQGKLQADKQRFPSGIPALAKYVQDKGLKLGLYLDTDNMTCNGYPGSQNYIQTDAKTLADWGVDAVWLDSCGVKDVHTLDKLYSEMGQSLNQTGRHMLYMCEWPYYQRSRGMQPDYNKIAQTCNAFKPYQNLTVSWVDLEKSIKWFGDNGKQLANHSGPGHWVFPDELLVGNYGLSENQERLHMALWSIMSAPLMVSADLRFVRPDQRELLLNAAAIGINQDPLGVMGVQIDLKGQVGIYKKAILPKGSYALLFYYTNISGGPSKVSVKLSDFGLTGPAAWNFTEVLTGTHMGLYKPWYTLNCEVNPTGVLLMQAIAIK